MHSLNLPLIVWLRHGHPRDQDAYHSDWQHATPLIRRKKPFFGDQAKILMWGRVYRALNSVYATALGNSDLDSPLCLQLILEAVYWNFRSTSCLWRLSISWRCPDNWFRRLLLSMKWNCPDNWFRRLSIDCTCLNDWCRVLSVVQCICLSNWWWETVHYLKLCR